MKQLIFMGNKIALFTMMIVAMLFTACNSDDKPEVSSTSILVTTQFVPEYSKATLGKVKITLRNINTGKETVYETDETGKLLIEKQPVDMYDITAVYEMSATDFEALTGVKASKASMLFSASATGIQLKPNEVSNISLKLNTATTEDFVLKTLYFAGSDARKAASDYDQFIEIYNNTDHVLFADSLCIAITVMNRYGNGHKNQNQRYIFLEDGRYDWSKTEGMVDVAGANDKYYYGNMIFMVPGTGKEHPVKPGESFIVASFARNFKASFQNLRGMEIKPESPELTVDLSHAEWEGVVSERYEALTNPDVPNLTLIHQGNNTYMRLSNNGKEGYVLFRHPKPSSLPVYKYPAKDVKLNSNATFMQFPIANVIDAVEVISPTQDGYLAPKALQQKDDAGYTYVKAGYYSSMCLTRKISHVDSGRKVLQDLNNSTIDFVEMKADPKGFAPQNRK